MAAGMEATPWYVEKAKPLADAAGMIDQDAQFFKQHPDRRARIRLPGGPKPMKDGQRAVRFLSECEMEFRSLGPHDKSRRRIIVWRTGTDHSTHPNYILRIPILLFGDETIEDTDAVLLPEVDRIMRQYK